MPPTTVQGKEVPGARRAVQPGRQVYRQVGAGGIKRGALGVLWEKAGEVKEQVAVHVRGGGANLAATRPSLAGEALPFVPSVRLWVCRA
jgi:hypothetical protein